MIWNIRCYLLLVGACFEWVLLQAGFLWVCDNCLKVRPFWCPRGLKRYHVYTEELLAVYCPECSKDVLKDIWI